MNDTKKTFTAEEMAVELTAAFLAQEHCRSLWGAARGHSMWRMTHDGFIAGYKVKREELTETNKELYAALVTLTAFIKQPLSVQMSHEQLAALGESALKKARGEA